MRWARRRSSGHCCAGWTLEMIAHTTDREHPFSPPAERLGLGTMSQLAANVGGTRLDCDEVDQDSGGSRPWHSRMVHSLPDWRSNRNSHCAAACIRTNKASSNSIKCHPRGPPLCCNAELSPLRKAQPTQEQRISYFSVGAEVGSSAVSLPPIAGTESAPQIQAYICLPGTFLSQCQAAHWTPRCRIELRSR